MVVLLLLLSHRHLLRHRMDSNMDSFQCWKRLRRKALHWWASIYVKALVQLQVLIFNFQSLGQFLAIFFVDGFFLLSIYHIISIALDPIIIFYLLLYTAITATLKKNDFIYSEKVMTSYFLEKIYSFSIKPFLQIILAIASTDNP